MKKQTLLAILVVGMMAVSGFTFSHVSAKGGSISPTKTCTFINSYKVSSGYTPSTNSTMGAVWIEWKLNPCNSPSGLGFDISVKLTEVSTGNVLYTIPGTFAQQTIDFDNLKTGTMYHVDYVISDHGTGQVLETRSNDALTPSHNQTGI